MFKAFCEVDLTCILLNHYGFELTQFQLIGNSCPKFDESRITNLSSEQLKMASTQLLT